MIDFDRVLVTLISPTKILALYESRDHPERDACRRQRHRLLAAATEDERVATLQTYDALAGRGFVDQQLVDLILRERMGGRFLADINYFRLGAITQQFWISQIVVNDDVSQFQ